MCRIVPFLLALGICAVSFADGIAVDRDTGKIHVPYTEVALTNDQIEELDCLGTVTFGREQWAGLRKVAPNVPKRVETVLPLDYDSCTCHIDYYCILIARGKMAVLHGNAVPDTTSHAFEYEEEVVIRVDAAGQFFYNGHVLDHAKLLEALGKPHVDGGGTASKERFLYFALPEMAGPVDAAVKARIDEAWKVARKAGWRSYEDVANGGTESDSGGQSPGN